MYFAPSHDGFWLLSPFYRFLVFRFSPLSRVSPSLSLSRSLRFLSIVLLDLAPPLR